MMNAQFSNDPYNRNPIAPGFGPSPLITDGTIPDIGRGAQSSPTADGTVSLKRLEHKIPGKAMSEYEKGASLRSKHKAQQALAHFQKAVEIDPEFIEAANDIGAAYADLNRPADAQAQFEKVIKIDPQYWRGYFNLAIMYLMNGDFDGAERAARRAMGLNRAGATTRMLLGMSLVLHDKFTDEAIDLLENTRDDYPQSHLFLARALAGRGKRQPARTELQTFLRSPMAANDKSAKELAESWLQALR